MFTSKTKIQLLGWCLLGGVLLGCMETPTPIPTPPVLTLPPPPVAQTTAEPNPSSPTGETTAEAPPLSETSPTAEPIAEPTPEPTFTPVSSEPAPTPATNPALQSVAAGNLPPINHPAFFLAGGNLWRWAVGGGLQPVVGGGDLTHLVVTPDGQRAAVVRRLLLSESRQMDEALGFDRLWRYEQSQIVFVDLISGEQWVIVPRVDNIQSVFIAPDGARVGFVGSGLAGEQAPRTAEDTPQLLFVMTTGGGSGPSVPQQVAACAGRCQRPLWHIESNLLVWADEAALWLFNTAGSQPERLLDNRLVETDIELFWPVAWARNGRSLLLDEYQFEWRGTAVLDVPTRQLIRLPESGEFMTFFPFHVQWMPDDRLLVGRSTPQPTIELWRVDWENGRVNREEALVVGQGGQGVLGTRHLDDGRFAYALSDPSAAVAGTYLVTSLSETPTRVNGIPAHNMADPFNVPHVSWDGSGTGALVQMGTAVYYAPTNGPALYDLSPILGQVAYAVWR